MIENSKISEPNKIGSNPENTRLSGARCFSVAPMMDWSDRHCRYLWRLISKNALLYTEMVTTGAVIHGHRERFLDYNSEEHPLALQLGGSDPVDLAAASKLAEQWGYDEVNLNCGCPSDRVQNGMIGAVLMQHPSRVADCVKAMRDATDIDVTVKHRIGVDDMEDYSGLVDFVGQVHEAGCNTFIVHARKAWLKGLSPKENREIPPLKYELVHQLKTDFPHLEIIINGGLATIEQCQHELKYLDGVMVGREAYSNPWLLAEVDEKIYGDTTEAGTRNSVALQYAAYCERQMQKGSRLHHVTRHMLGLFHGMPGARSFRRHISQHAYQEGADISVLMKALEYVGIESRETI